MFHLNRVIGDACSSAIVGLQGRGRLGMMAQFLRGSLDWACLFGIEESAPSSASAALDMTERNMWHKMSMAPLAGGGGSRCEGEDEGRELRKK